MRIKWYLNRTKRNQDTQQQQLGYGCWYHDCNEESETKKKQCIQERERGTHIKYAVKVIVVLFALAF